MKFLTWLIPLLVLSGCGVEFAQSDRFIVASSIGRAAAPNQPTHLVGKPYYNNGRFVRPRHQPNYEAVGKASWFSNERNGRRTANGEIVDSTNLFAAHPSLPLPSYVNVKNLRTGNELTVRVNDRDPVDPNNVIALSERAAELLDLMQFPDAKVRVRFLSPAPIEHTGRFH